MLFWDTTCWHCELVGSCFRVTVVCFILVLAIGMEARGEGREGRILEMIGRGTESHALWRQCVGDVKSFLGATVWYRDVATCKIWLIIV